LYSLTWLDLTCLIVMGGCIQTIAVRLGRIDGALKARDEMAAKSGRQH